MADLAQAYSVLTGTKVVTPGMRRYLLVCYRLHGQRTLELLQRLYAESGSTENLLAKLRDYQDDEVREPDPVRPASPDGIDDIDAFLDGLAWVGDRTALPKRSPTTAHIR